MVLHRHHLPLRQCHSRISELDLEGIWVVTDDLEQIASTVAQNCNGEESIAQIEANVRELAPDLEAADVAKVAEGVRSQFPVFKRLPHLIVDWKTPPTIGSQCSPQFLLVLSDEYSGATPEIDIALNPRLDYEYESATTELQRSEKGHWDWFFPFALTKNGLDCLPGDYILSIAIRFAGLNHPTLPRHLRTDIRLTVPRASDGEQVLEIDADGKSIVNLQGMDLRQFGTIKLSGSDDAIVNALHVAGNEPESKHDDAADRIVHEYRLRPDNRFEFEGLFLSESIMDGSRAPKASLTLGERNVILYSQPSLRLGRSRGADIVTRFLPRSEEHDTHSKNLSRIHADCFLNEDGMVITSDSSTGFELDFTHCGDSGEMLLPKERLNDQIELGLGQFLKTQFKMSVTPIGNNTNQVLKRQDRQRIEDLAERNYMRQSRLWKTSESTDWECVQFKRLENLEEEEYVVICQYVQIGSSFKLCGITDKRLPSVAARILYLNNTFHICGYDNSSEVSINGHRLQTHEVAPLSFGDMIDITGVKMEFDKAYQKHI